MKQGCGVDLDILVPRLPHLLETGTPTQSHLEQKLQFLSLAHRVKYIFDLESIRPIRTAENFEAVEWATGFSNINGCIVGLIDTAAGRVTSFYTSFC